MITPKISYIKELVEPEHQLFHHRIQSCSYNLNRQELSKILIDNMIHHNGIGISANQIGIWERAFAMIRDLEHHEVMVCFNPRIVKSYAEEVEIITKSAKNDSQAIKWKCNGSPQYSLDDSDKEEIFCF